MKVWLDDVRPKPDEFDIWITNAATAINVIRTGGVMVISLDHDLGDPDAKTGYDVACAIEEGAYRGTIPPLEIRVHSANPVGRKNIEACVQKCKKYWAQNYAT